MRSALTRYDEAHPHPGNGRGDRARARRRRAVLMKNHGIAVAGASIEEAVITTIMLETAAMIQMIAEAAGALAPEFPPEDIAQLQHEISRPEQFAINFDYLVRALTSRR